MLSNKKKNALIAVALILIIVGGLYITLKLKKGGNNSSSPPTVIETATTTAQINSNNFNVSGQTYSSTSSNSSTANLLNGMTMTFDDEFNTFSRYVDANGNVTCDPGGTGTWQTVYYFCSRTNPGNYEAEVYTDPNFIAYLKNEPVSTAQTDANDPFSINSGVLSIEATPSTPQILSAVGSWAQYTSGIITTQFSFSQEYGYFEMRAELPAGAGLWPAFWLLPTNKSWPPEIDALEAFGAQNPQGDGGLTMIHYASHALEASDNCGGWYNVDTNITAGFHTYGVNIEPSGITYYFDGNAYASCPANPEINQPFYMLINLAVGSNASWPGSPASTNTWPAYLKIDYVRAYKNN
jgi:beta-glucanase (GH16 family)